VSVNRIRKLLVAVLNRAFEDGHGDSDLAWRRVPGFKGVDRARTDRTYYVHLTDDARAFFEEISAGRARDDLLFVHADGSAFAKSHQKMPMEAASTRAGIVPPINFHALRHTFASHAVMAGIPLMVIAEALGQTDTRMVTQHYGHMSKDYSAKVIRELAPSFGIKPSGNVRPLR
jgi:integrase